MVDIINKKKTEKARKMVKRMIKFDDLIDEFALKNAK